MDPTHLTNYLSLLKCSNPDLVLISKEGDNIPTWKLLVSFFSPTIADLVRECYEWSRTIQDAISLPFDKDELRTFVDLVENSDVSRDALTENKVALFLGVCSIHPPGYDHKEDKTRIYNAGGTKKVKEEDILFNLQLDDIKRHLPNISAQIETDKSNFEKDDKTTKAVMMMIVKWQRC